MAKPTDQTPKLFGGGVPTEPEFRKLCDAWPELAPGDRVTYEELEEAIGALRTSNRYGSVFSRWRRYLFRERNVVLRNVPKTGYEVADPAQRVNISTSTAAAGKRRIVRAAAVAATTDAKGLTEAQERARAHIASLPGRLKLLEATAPRSE